MSEKPVAFTESQILASALAIGGPAFVAALSFTLPQEGLVDEIVTGDPGKETVCGITAADFAAYLAEHSLPSRPVSTITASEIAHTYFEHYWQKLNCQNFQQPVALCLWDAAVNVGAGESVMLLQHALGIAVDGKLGPATLAAEHNYVVAHGAKALALAMIAQRRFYYTIIKDPSGSRPGWLNRCRDLEVAVS